LSELRASDMGEDKIRYLLPVSGRWRWRPTRAMRARGFKLVTFGRELTATDKARAIALNAEWDQVRMGVRAAAGEQELPFPAGTVGDGYQRAMRLRALERDAKGITRTKEQTKRDDWPRGWKWLGPVFGDQDPKTVTPEELLALRRKVAERISPTEAHRVIKVWRAMWKKLQAFGYCTGKDGPRSDPSLAFSNTAPDPRQDVWHHDEVVRLVEHAWVRGNKGLAALMAVIWDSMLSPGDARMLTPASPRHARSHVLSGSGEDRTCCGRHPHVLVGTDPRNLHQRSWGRSARQCSDLPNCWKWQRTAGRSAMASPALQHIQDGSRLP
jgi:hypothetical protein